MQMEAFLEKIRPVLLQTLKLKSLKRSGWQRTSLADVESVASHSWGVAWIAMLFCPGELCKERVLELALIHDLAESVVGDITPYDGISAVEKMQRELSAFRDLTRDLPNAEQLLECFREYQECVSQEAVYVHNCDKVDMWLQAELYMLENPGMDLREFVESARVYLCKGIDDNLIPFYG